MQPSAIAAIAVSVSFFIALFVVWLVTYSNLRKLRSRFAAVIDVEKETAKAEKENTRAKKDLEDFLSKSAADKARLNAEFNEGKGVYENLRREIFLLEENIEDISFGIYKPHFHFEDSEKYKKELMGAKDRQKVLIRAGRAAAARKEWLVGGSRKEGKRMQNQYMKLLLRAFNGECDAAIANVSWNNVLKMEERVKKSFEAVTKLGGVMEIFITEEYLNEKLSELRLTFEYAEKKQEEREEQREIREQMREEEKALKEAEKAKRDAEKEQKNYEDALLQARAELKKATAEETDALAEKIRLLEEQLEAAQAKRERATSMAELTRSGHVYIISNVGSFGDGMLKIGMTRRLEPMDRVKELGDASVPFTFDVHAMIYSKDAPTLENELHNHFSSRRVNMINSRKEFFFVSLNEVEEFARKKDLDLELTKLAEAKEYRATLALREEAKRKDEPSAQQDEQFPQQLWT